MHLQHNMELQHIINGEYMNGLSFQVQSPFANVIYTIKLPRLKEKEITYARTSIRKADIPSLGERRELLHALAGYQPSQQTLQAICLMTGAPISIVQERINEGRSLVRMFAEREDVSESVNRKTMFVAIPSNDPREAFYFTGHALLAGTPTILKPSKREPVLGTDLVSHLLKSGLPPGYFNVLYGDSSEREDANLIRELVNDIDIPIVMGDAKISNRQLTFNADHSRGLVLESTMLGDHPSYSIEAPLSCLAEHNYLVVGKENFERVKENIIARYQTLRSGDLLDQKTRRGLIEDSTLNQGAALLNEGRANDTMKVLYPSHLQNGRIDAETIKNGLVIEHYSEDPGVGVNLCMDTVLPFYITALRRVDSLEQAITDLERAKSSIEKKTKGERSMALAVYGNSDPDVLSRLESIAFDIHENESPMFVNGWRHQGINLQEVLTK